MSFVGVDSALLDAARRGDRDAFATLVERHYPMLLAGCRRMLRDPDLAREAAQEAVVRAMLGLDGLRDADRFGAWLTGIGLNVCRSLLAARRRRVTTETPFDVDTRRGSSTDPAAVADPATIVEARELGVLVREAIAALPSGQRDAVALFYLGGLTHAEIAEEVGTARGAIKTRLHKARRHLRAHLLETYEEEFAMPTDTPGLVEMHVAELRRTASEDPLAARHVVLLHDATDRRLAIWIGLPEATALAIAMEGVELPRPGAYQFAAGLLAAAGATLREVHVTELTDATFYARAVLADGTTVDARPSDAITLAIVIGAPILVAERVLAQVARERDTMLDLVREAEQATDDARTIAEETRRRWTETARIAQGRTDP